MVETVTKGKEYQTEEFLQVMGWQRQIYIHVHMYASAAYRCRWVVGGWMSNNCRDIIVRSC